MITERQEELKSLIDTLKSLGQDIGIKDIEDFLILHNSVCCKLETKLSSNGIICIKCVYHAWLWNTNTDKVNEKYGTNYRMWVANQ